MVDNQMPKLDRSVKAAPMYKFYVRSFSNIQLDRRMDKDSILNSSNCQLFNYARFNFANHRGSSVIRMETTTTAFAISEIF